METTVAFAIISLLFVGIANLGISTIAYTLSAKTRTQNTALAQQALEIIRSNGTFCKSIDPGKFYKIDPGGKDILESAAADGFEDVPNHPGFQRKIEAFDITEASNKELGETKLHVPSLEGSAFLIIKVTVKSAPIPKTGTEETSINGLIQK